MSNQNIDLGGYITVDERLREFFKKYPDGRMRPVNPDHPFTIERIPDGSGQEHTYIVYAAAAYRTPDDPNPAIGIAYEQFPGRTPYTRTSELMNAETSAWGRALAAMGIGVKGKIASRDEVYAATQRRSEPEPERGNGQRQQRPVRTAQQIAEEALQATTVAHVVRLATEAGPGGRQVEVHDPNGEGEPMKLGILLTQLKEKLAS
ncbi:hypothetical protein [Streptomyces mirabilis]|uniref:hypothetical protein n=1 Tax=Streptomyces mirabilis TaxID=68239 RepID=UPI003685D88E